MTTSNRQQTQTEQMMRRPRPTISKNDSDDRGTILPMVLIMMVLGSVLVVALLGFAITLFRNRPPLEQRSDSLEAVRSGMRMAIVLQRDHGADGCFEAPTNAFDLNGRTVTIECRQIEDKPANGGRLALMTTATTASDDPDANPFRGNLANTNGSLFRGDVFLNGGNLTGDAGALKLSGGDLIGSTYNATMPGYRYETTPTAVPVETIPAGSDCASIFGTHVDEAVFTGPLFAEPDAQITAVPIGVDGVRISPNSAGTSLKGLFIEYDASFGGSGTKLVRLATGTETELIATTEGSPLPPGVTTARACYQTVPNTNPSWIPFDRTFCDSVLMAEEINQVGEATDGISCVSEPWWDYAGWKPSIASSSRQYPLLPQIPTYSRALSPYDVTAGCAVLYPGRYPGPVNLDQNKNYYLASGVYVFEDTFRIAGDARVVAGEGIWKGCAFDADAAFLNGAPRNHEITGKGATFLLAGDGRLEVDDASLRVNNRIATSSTRASSSMSVMSINLATGSGADVVIPENDKVLLPGCLPSYLDPINPDYDPTCAEPVDTYGFTPFTGASELSYTPSNLGSGDVIINASLNGSSIGRNRVFFGGHVFVPNAQVALTRSGAGDTYGARFLGGLVASTVDLSFQEGGSNRLVGGREVITAYQKVELISRTEFSNDDFRSVVELELDNADRYAINNWTVEPGTGTPVVPVNPGPGGPTPPDPPDPSLPSKDFCATPQGWTNGFSPANWDFTVYDIPNNNSMPSDPFGGVIQYSDTETDVDFPQGSTQMPGTAPSSLSYEYFSSIWETTFNVPTDCTIDMRLRGNNAYRVYIDGVLQSGLSHWDTQYTNDWQRQNNTVLTAGDHTIRIEHVNTPGQWGLDLQWKS